MLCEAEEIASFHIIQSATQISSNQLSVTLSLYWILERIKMLRKINTSHKTYIVFLTHVAGAQL